MRSIEGQLEQLSQGAATLLPVEELRRKLERSLAKGRPLRTKLGIDPSAPSITLGQAVPLRKLRQFQDLGHTAVLIVGDFTRRIGDPSGRTSTRPPMSPEEIEENMQTYVDQVYKILDPDRTEFRYNSEWLGRLSFEDVIRLSSRYTVARMLERDDFKGRFKNNLPITIMEFLYPLAQAYDSVAIEADVELGGEDQRFNLLVARAIQEAFGQEPQVILTMPLLIGTDGQRVMSQSRGNYIGIAEPPGEMFGKVMSLPDHLLIHYFTLLTDISPEEIAEMEKSLSWETINPRDFKMRLAREITSQFHSKEAAADAEDEFVRVYQKGKLPSQIRVVAKELLSLQDQMTFVLKGPDGKIKEASFPVIDLLVQSGLANSRSEARRLIDQGGVQLDGKEIRGLEPIRVKNGAVLRVGKRRFVRLSLEGSEPTD